MPSSNTHKTQVSTEPPLHGNRKMSTSTIHGLLENSKFSEALPIINFNIKTTGVTNELIQAKVFCLINLNKFTLALSTIKMAQKRDNLRKDLFLFDSAYCLYRLGKFSASINVIVSRAESDPRFKLLKAQALYRLERFEEAAELFQILLQNDDFLAEELQVNILASQSQARLPTDHVENKSFDSTYNLALAKLLSGDFKEAEKLATDCEKFNHDDNTSPSALINAQLILICSLLSSKDNWPEAECLLRKLKTNSNLTSLQKTIITANLMRMATNRHGDELANFLGSKTGEDVFKLKEIDGLGLFKSQRRQIITNYHSLGLNVPDVYSHEFPKKTLNDYIPDSMITIESLKNDPRFTSKLTASESKKIEKVEKTLKVSKKTAKITKEAPKTLDKERWLPLRDRSYYKSKEQYQKSIKKAATRKTK